MIKHALATTQKVVSMLNPGQIPIVTLDQPLYALSNQIQCHWPQQFWEDKFVILMGGLHIQMAALHMLGHWLDESGCVECLVQAGIASSGIAHSILKCSHVKRSRYAHIISAAALYVTLQHQYASYCKKCT